MIAILSQIFASLCKIDRKSPEEDNDWLQQPPPADRQTDTNIQIWNMDLDIDISDIYYKLCKKLSLFNTR